MTNPSPTQRPGRNEPCHCGSGRKYKQCCLAKDEASAREAREAKVAEATPAADAPAQTSEALPPRKTPKHLTHQPWKRTTANTHGFQRVSTPRKVGGG